jgi:uncharacterized membrane protein YsdA (DUF1294 family)
LGWRERWNKTGSISIDKKRPAEWMWRWKQNTLWLINGIGGYLVSYLRAKSESKSVTPDTAFRFNSKDL